MKKNLFSKIEDVLGEIPHGWCSVRKAQTLAAIILATRPEVVVEIGVYAGRSFVPMVMGLQEVGRGVAIGIDPYDAAVSAAGEVDANKEWWGNLDHGEIERFAREVLGAVDGHRQHWELWKKRSDDVAPWCDVRRGIGLLHVDGSHTEQAFRDVERFAVHVIKGGFVVLDDLLWEGGEVSRSIEALEVLGFRELYRAIGPEPGTRFEDNWGVFQRVG